MGGRWDTPNECEQRIVPLKRYGAVNGDGHPVTGWIHEEDWFVSHYKMKIGDEARWFSAILIEIPIDSGVLSIGPTVTDTGQTMEITVNMSVACIQTDICE